MKLKTEPGETLTVYVKANSNCPAGMPLQTFELFSPVWEGDAIRIPFDGGAQTGTVRGWSTLGGGQPCRVRVARVRHQDSGSDGWLVWGGDAGVSIECAGETYGQPIVWVEDAEDLPEAIRLAIAVDALQNANDCEE